VGWGGGADLFVVGIFEAGPEEGEVFVGWGFGWHRGGGGDVDGKMCEGLEGGELLKIGGSFVLWWNVV